VPIFDTAFAIIRRLLTGRHPFSADRGHLHHRLIDMGFNKKQTMRILYAVSALLGTSSIMLVTHKIIYAVIIIAVSLAVSTAMWIIFRDPKMKVESGLIGENGNGDHEKNGIAANSNNKNNILKTEEQRDSESLEKYEKYEKYKRSARFGKIKNKVYIRRK
jgi:hypothetical protein